MPIKNYVKRSLNQFRTIRFQANLPATAKAQLRKDRLGLPDYDPGIERSVVEAVNWLLRAQECSRSSDGGVARDYSFINGWNTSYPETTGYIIPTLLRYAGNKGDEKVRTAAIEMLDWLCSIQFPEGGFQGGTIGASPRVPVTFNTGQILMGLAEGAKSDQKYVEPMRSAATWLSTTLDDDGCWRKHPSPFAERGEKVYETHVAWGLLEAARADNNNPAYSDAALANIKWAINHQESNGWFQSCCLSDPSEPLTHTIGYALRGILEGYLFTGNLELLASCERTAHSLVERIWDNGFLAGRLNRSWNGTVDWSCLTGSVQIAYCLLTLARQSGDSSYRDAGCALNKYVRRTISLDGPLEFRGAVKGAFPLSGGYCSYEFPNWATKFFVDSNLLEADLY